MSLQLRPQSIHFVHLAMTSRIASLEIQLKHKIATTVCIFCILLGIIFPFCRSCFGK